MLGNFGQHETRPKLLAGFGRRREEITPMLIPAVMLDQFGASLEGLSGHNMPESSVRAMLGESVASSANLLGRMF